MHAHKSKSDVSPEACDECMRSTEGSDVAPFSCNPRMKSMHDADVSLHDKNFSSDEDTNEEEEENYNLLTIIQFSLTMLMTYVMSMHSSRLLILPMPKHVKIKQL